MNIDVYQLWDAIGGVDEKLIYETLEYHEIQRRKSRNLIWGLSAAACVMLCALSFKIINHMTSVKENHLAEIDKGNSNNFFQNGKSNTNKDISNVSEPSIQPSKDEKVEVNRGCNYFNAKYGGTIKKVSKKIWSEKFDNDIFKCDSDTKYFLSYSKKNEVLYGKLEIKVKDNEIVTVLVGKNVMIDSEYSQLSKTNINGVNMAICAIEGSQNYGSVYSKSHVAYTIEWSEGGVSEFISALKEVVETQ
ncbi:MAG: hypothetical protein NC489_40510 [Ruminococcus flavefaciens]|nr:hypothetical protein [Ruminococcus flavefaciens]